MKQEQTKKRDAERQAAQLLMKEYVMNHSSEVASVLSGILPFFEECSYHGLQSAMNTVNVTFATVALEVIKSSWDNDSESPDRIELPVDASEMQQAIFYLSKIVGMLAHISAFAENNDPAIRMCMELNSNNDIKAAG